MSSRCPATEPDRRRFLAGAATLAGAGALSLALPGRVPAQEPGFRLLSLPYAENALEPVIGARTVSIHHGKHHAAYVDQLNRLASAAQKAGASLPRIIREAWRDKNQALFNNAGQVFNHDFYWRSLRPGGGSPEGELLAKIKAELGGLDKLLAELKKAGLEQFGSGWAWLLSKDGRLAVDKTPNAVPALGKDTVPLLVVDVWEHAYYLDYQNRRGDYLDAVLARLLNWEFAAANLAGRRSQS